LYDSNFWIIVKFIYESTFSSGSDSKNGLRDGLYSLLSIPVANGTSKSVLGLWFSPILFDALGWVVRTGGIAEGCNEQGPVPIMTLLETVAGSCPDGLACN